MKRTSLAGRSIIARADALIRRRRDDAAIAEDPPILLDALPTDDEDLPLLTEVAPTSHFEDRPISPVKSEQLDPLIEQILNKIALSLPDLIDTVVEQSMVDFRKRLSTQLSHLAESAIRDALSVRPDPGQSDG